MQEHARQELLDKAVELEEAQLETGHVGRVVRAEVVGFHEPDEDAEGFFVGHLQAGLASEKVGNVNERTRRTFRSRGPTMNCSPWV